jgi:hypothetical protein
MHYLLLHKRHGTEEWLLLKEGSAQTIQSFLKRNGCRKEEDWRVIAWEGECKVEKSAKDELPTFYTCR